jgi:hypothetical protein
MAQIKTIELARQDLFTAKEELLQRYDAARVEHLMRLRDMYNWYLANPSEPDRKFVTVFMGRYGIAQSKVYADLAIIKELIPILADASREFHRARISDMLLDAYNMAKRRKDTKAMIMAAKELAKINRVELEDEKTMPFEMIVVQPFTPSFDPTLVGIKPIPNVDEVKAALKRKLAVDIPDIEDVTYEEADLQEETLFPETPEAS